MAEKILQLPIDMISATGHADRSVWDVLNSLLSLINLPLNLVDSRYTVVRPAGKLGSVPAWSRDSVGDKREGRRRPVLVHVAENILRLPIDMISATGHADRSVWVQENSLGNWYFLPRFSEE